ncbi:OmpA family protein [Pseudoxanthomonas yeongjuensis]|uniref:OmpA family protein n=1 Tax=Pseudoxanthomonas yeongjuensis TaxID=377616 RepID=UPI0024841E82|nr:OmpA family protein [Pseudoxanthomonas yeongjuensis]
MLPVNGWLGSSDANAHAPAAISASADPAHLAKLYFAVDAATPSDAEAALGLVLATLQANPDSKARVSGYHDATGSAARNEELAKQRAQTVQQLLIANGIGEDRIVLEKPVLSTGDGSADEVRRVEVLVE